MRISDWSSDVCSSDLVSGALIAIGLVLVAVFVPTAFVPGIPGIFYQQFAVTIASATVFSLLTSLTLSPALAALLLKPHQRSEEHTSELQSLMRISYAVFCLHKKINFIYIIPITIV